MKPSVLSKFVTIGLATLLWGVFDASAQTIPPPRIFFTDLTSGPNVGGETVGGFSGSYVTIYGNYFGPTQGTGTVTLNGANCLRVVSWGIPWLWYQKVIVQLGSTCTSGNFTVTTATGSSNAVPFAVRSGNIRCVSTPGNDSNSGAFPSCWSSIAHAVHSIAAGDIAYVLDGVIQNTIDNYNCDISIQSGSNDPANPMALVAYPGAVATIGTTSQSCALRIPAISGTHSHWILAGMVLRGNGSIDLNAQTGWRIIGNDASCPGGSGQAACIHAASGSSMYIYGNYIHNVGDQHGSIDKYYHGLYLTTNTNHVWVGFNEINNNPTGSTTSGGCRALQFYSTGGSDQFDLHVFNNYIHNAICDGINFSTVNADNGPVEAYNNVVFHVGTGPDPANGSANYSCLVGGGLGTTPVLVYNNTFYDCGARKNPDSGSFYVARPIGAFNNIMQQINGEPFFTSAGSSQLTGSNNVWFGGSAPSATTGNITVDPLFISVLAGNFNLQASSPAIRAGSTNYVPGADFVGQISLLPPSIGAYETSGAPMQRPNPPTNLIISVQ